MSFKIAAIAPTPYQLNSLEQFGLPITVNGIGRYMCMKLFDTEQEAKDYLIERSNLYYDEYEGQVDSHIDNINQYGILEIDSVTAYIHKMEDEDELTGDNSELDSDAWIDEDDSYLTAQDERDYDAELLSRLHGGDFNDTMPIETDIEYWLTNMAKAKLLANKD